MYKRRRRNSAFVGPIEYCNVLLVYSTKTYLTISHLKINPGISFKPIVPNSRVDSRADLLSVRIINVWNRLSDQIANASSNSHVFDKLVKTDLSFAVIGKL